MNVIRMKFLKDRTGHISLSDEERNELNKLQITYKEELEKLDEKIAPLASESSRLMNDRWGLLMRAGSDKSHFTRQVEQYADIYMARVSDFLQLTPFAYLRSIRSNLPHD